MAFDRIPHQLLKLFYASVEKIKIKFENSHNIFYSSFKHRLWLRGFAEKRFQTYTVRGVGDD